MVSFLARCSESMSEAMAGQLRGGLSLAYFAPECLPGEPRSRARVTPVGTWLARRNAKCWQSSHLRPWYSLRTRRGCHVYIHWRHSPVGARDGPNDAGPLPAVVYLRERCPSKGDPVSRVSASRAADDTGVSKGSRPV